MPKFTQKLIKEALGIKASRGALREVVDLLNEATVSIGSLNPNRKGDTKPSVGKGHLTLQESLSQMASVIRYLHSHTVLNNGNMVEDDIGFNIPDYHFFSGYLASGDVFESDLEIPVPFHYIAAKRLWKYKNSQLEEFGGGKALKKIIDSLAAQMKSEGISIPNTMKRPDGLVKISKKKGDPGGSGRYLWDPTNPTWFGLNTPETSSVSTSLEFYGQSDVLRPFDDYVIQHLPIKEGGNPYTFTTFDVLNVPEVVRVLRQEKCFAIADAVEAAALVWLSYPGNKGRKSPAQWEVNLESGHLFDIKWQIGPNGGLDLSVGYHIAQMIYEGFWRFTDRLHSSPRNRKQDGIWWKEFSWDAVPYLARFYRSQRHNQKMFSVQADLLDHLKSLSGSLQSAQEVSLEPQEVDYSSAIAGKIGPLSWELSETPGQLYISAPYRFRDFRSWLGTQIGTRVETVGQKKQFWFLYRIDMLTGTQLKDYLYSTSYADANWTPATDSEADYAEWHKLLGVLQARYSEWMDLELKKEVDPSDLRAAKRLWRRIQHMVHPKMQEEPKKIELALHRAAKHLRKVEPGTLEVSMGSSGSWKIRFPEESVEKIPLLVYRKPKSFEERRDSVFQSPGSAFYYIPESYEVGAVRKKALEKTIKTKSTALRRQLARQKKSKTEILRRVAEFASDLRSHPDELWKQAEVWVRLPGSTASSISEFDDKRLIMNSPSAQVFKSLGKDTGVIRRVRMDPSQFDRGAEAGPCVVDLICPLEQTPSLCYALELNGFHALANTLRASLFLDNMESKKDCYILDQLSSAYSVEDIEDRQVANQVEEFLNSQVRPLFPTKNGFNPYPYQEIGTAYAHFSKHRYMNADEMGLGKTIQAILSLRIARKSTPAIVFCPLMVRSSWKEKIEEWAPELNPIVLSNYHRGKHPSGIPRLKKGDVFITSWAHLAVPGAKERIQELGIQTLIGDESHYIKNPSAKRSQSFQEIAGMVPYVLELTGTPMENAHTDLWHQFYCLDSDLYVPEEDLEGLSDRERKKVSLKAFKDRYVKGKRKVFHVWHLPEGSESRQVVFVDPHRKDAAQLREIQIDNRCIMIRREKKDVAKFLPALTTDMLSLELSSKDKAYYESLEERHRNDLCERWRVEVLSQSLSAVRKKKGLSDEDLREVLDRYQDKIPLVRREVLTLLGELRREVASLKVPYVVDWLLQERAQFLKEKKDPPSYLIFVEHKDACSTPLLKLMRSKGLKVGLIDGTTSSAKREKAVSDFISGKIKYLVGSVEALGTGTDGLQKAASRIIFMERNWRPTKEEQAEARLHRPGQTEDVLVLYTKVLETIDEWISNLVESKRRGIRAILAQEQRDIPEGAEVLSRKDDQDIEAQLIGLVKTKCVIEVSELRALLSGR